MHKIDLYLLDTRNRSLDEFHLERFKCDYKEETTRLEKQVSSYLKKKYIGEFYLNEFGKPLSIDKIFNISHSKGVVALAISKEFSIGLDVEVIRDYKDETAKYISSDEEYASIKDNESFFTIWTNKEALVKCLGTGVKEEVKKIPAIPIDGLKRYKDHEFITKTIKIKDLIVTIALETTEPFEINLITL